MKILTNYLWIQCSYSLEIWNRYYYECAIMISWGGTGNHSDGLEI